MVRFLTSPEEAVADIPDGAVIALGGFAGVGVPSHLVRALLRQGARDLTLICNAGHIVRPHIYDAGDLVAQGRVRRLITTFASHPSPRVVGPAEERWRAGDLEVEVVPQGILAERLRAGGAGIPAFWSPVGVGTPLAEGKEVRRNPDGSVWVLEYALPVDYALIKAWRADPLGNLVYRRTARNFNPVMATCARVTVAEVEEVVPLGALEPEAIVTPGVYVDRVVAVPPLRTKEEG